MEGLLDFLAFMKILPFFLYIILRYVLSLSLVMNAGLRLAMNACGSRLMMGLAFGLSLTVTFWIFLPVRNIGARTVTIYALSAMMLLALYFWWRGMKGIAPESRHSGFEPLTIFVSLAVWIFLLVASIIKNGLIAH